MGHLSPGRRLRAGWRLRARRHIGAQLAVMCAIWEGRRRSGVLQLRRE